VVFGVRVSPDLNARLDAAIKKRGGTQAEALEHMLDVYLSAVETENVLDVPELANFKQSQKRSMEILIEACRSRRDKVQTAEASVSALQDELLKAKASLADVQTRFDTAAKDFKQQTQEWQEKIRQTDTAIARAESAKGKAEEQADFARQQYTKLTKENEILEDRSNQLEEALKRFEEVGPSVHELPSIKAQLAETLNKLGIAQKIIDSIPNEINAAVLAREKELIFETKALLDGQADRYEEKLSALREEINRKTEQLASQVAETKIAKAATQTALEKIAELETERTTRRELKQENRADEKEILVEQTIKYKERLDEQEAKHEATLAELRKELVLKDQSENKIINELDSRIKALQDALANNDGGKTS
jgi:hypothetical protein